MISEMACVRNTSFRSSSEPTVSRVLSRTFPTTTLHLSTHHLGVKLPQPDRAISRGGKRKRSTQRNPSHWPEIKRKAVPRRGRSRTFYPRAARSRSTLPPLSATSQVEHHNNVIALDSEVNLSRLRIRPFHDRGPGIARPSGPSIRPAGRPTPSNRLTQRAKRADCPP